MKTQIFESQSAFYQREDKLINGVSKEFAELYPDYEKQNKNNEGCWNCSGCSDCSGCSRCSRCYDCSDCSDCSGCSGCSGCSRCYDCSDCSDCSGCSGCSGCSRCSDCSRCSRCYDCSDCSDCSGCYDLNNASPMERTEENKIVVPVIENIHQKVFDAVTNVGTLKMSSWHEDENKNDEGAYCGTTHCRAGWVIAIAGREGVKLESFFGTENAAMQIYHKSSPEIGVSPTRFYQSNEVALEDIERCAKEEISLQNKPS